MGLIHDLARKLAAALKDAPETRAFQAAKKKVMTDRKAEQLLTQFRTRQLELSALQMQGKRIDSSQAKELERMAQELQSSAVIKEYVEAEARLGQLWTDVQTMLTRAVGMEAGRK